jgi:hypothetical protein
MGWRWEWADMVQRIERFRAKWNPVRVKKTRQNKNLEDARAGGKKIRGGFSPPLEPISRNIKPLQPDHVPRSPSALQSCRHPEPSDGGNWIAANLGRLATSANINLPLT